MLARGAGLAAGRAAAWLAAARTKFAQFSKEAELSQVSPPGEFAHELPLNALHVIV